MTKNDISISVVIPVFNEEKSLPEFFPQLRKVLKNCGLKSSEVIAVNDCSTDSSLLVLERFKKTRIVDKIINNDVNLGYGSSLKVGIVASKYEYILIIDSDSTYPLEEIPSLLKGLGKYPMVIGARIRKGVQIPYERRLAKKIVLFVARIFTGSKILDINSGMRVFSKKIAYKFWHLYPNRWSMSSTLTLCFELNNYRVLYLPIGYKKRVGRSTIRSIDFFYFIGLIIRLVVYFKPFKFFFLPGLTFIVIGFTWILYTLTTERNITDTGLIIFITGLQTSFFGLIADLIVKTRQHDKQRSE